MILNLFRTFSNIDRARIRTFSNIEKGKIRTFSNILILGTASDQRRLTLVFCLPLA